MINHLYAILAASHATVSIVTPVLLVLVIGKLNRTERTLQEVLKALQKPRIRVNGWN